MNINSLDTVCIYIFKVQIRHFPHSYLTLSFSIPYVLIQWKNKHQKDFSGESKEKKICVTNNWFLTLQSKSSSLFHNFLIGWRLSIAFVIIRWMDVPIQQWSAYLCIYEEQYKSKLRKVRVIIILCSHCISKPSPIFV